MTQRDDKLAFERRMAESVGRHVSALKVDHGDAPDAVVHLQQGAAGLEVVSAVANDFAQAWVFTVKRLSPAISSALQGRGLECFVQYAIEVPEHFPLVGGARTARERRERNEWVAALPARIADLASRGPALYDRKELELLGVERLVSVHVQPSARTHALPAFHWSAAPVHTLAEGLLRAKEDRLTHYRKRRPDLAEFWLAIGPFGPGVVEDGGFHTLLDRKYTTTFDRVFLVDTDHGNTTEVTPHREPSSDAEPAP